MKNSELTSFLTRMRDNKNCTLVVDRHLKYKYEFGFLIKVVDDKTHIYVKGAWLPI